MLAPQSSHSQVPLHGLLDRVSDALKEQQMLPSRLASALRVIAQEMGATTAILYLLTPDHYLEAYAAYDSMTPYHKKIRFRVGEGLVGFIAGTFSFVLAMETRSI
jgi:signal transduction protein with GAF and PtsI domain